MRTRKEYNYIVCAACVYMPNSINLYLPTNPNQKASFEISTLVDLYHAVASRYCLIHITLDDSPTAKFNWG